MLPKSIRWRLPLSYAAIVLLASLALGIVLLTTVRGYYARQEGDYLRGNAQRIADSVSRLLATGVATEALPSQVDTFAFLTRTRLRLLDAQGQVLADSGVPESVRVVTGPELTSAHVYWTTETGEIRTFADEPTRVKVWMAPISPTTEIYDTYVHIAPIEGIPAVRTLYGFRLGREPMRPAVTAPRSDQSVRTDFYDRAGNLLGTVELSDGPAFGREIVSSVAWAWAIASGVAVVLAGGVGWLVSRQMSGPLLALTDVTARMAKGDLSARADVARQDEFGALARSFNQMAGRVEETVTTLRRFVADAAHELHTPLTALRTNLELAAEAGPEEEARFVAQAREQATRLEGLTEGLLDLSQLEAGAASAPYEADRPSGAGAAGERGLRFTGRAGRHRLHARPARKPRCRVWQRRPAAPCRRQLARQRAQIHSCRGQHHPGAAAG